MTEVLSVCEMFDKSEENVPFQSGSAGSGNKDSSESIDLDHVIREIGEFKRSQIVRFVLMSIPTAMATTLLFNYVFTVAILDYRCKIPECDAVDNDLVVYRPPWIEHAIPLDGSKSDKCHRFKVKHAVEHYTGECFEDLFNQTIAKCTEYVFKDNEMRLSKKFGLVCGNEYQLSFVGIANNVGRFISMPISGVLSDRYGRLTVLIWGTFISSIFGIIQAFSVTYEMYLVLEFCVAFACTGILGTGFILAAEWTTAKYRVLISALMSWSNPVYETYMALAAMYFTANLKGYLLAIFIPGLFLFTYNWLIDESPRWLLSAGYRNRAEKVLIHQAKSNGREISSETLSALWAMYQKQQKVRGIDQPANTAGMHQVVTVFRTKSLRLRFFVLSFCWIVNSFVFYGMTLSSVHLQNDSNKYLSFIVIAWSVIPGTLIAYLVVDRLGRRRTYSFALLISGVSIICSGYVGTTERFLPVVIVLFMIAKSAILCGFLVLYIFTAELWPTLSRNTMMGLCSMIGRVGGALAAPTILLVTVFPEMPYYLFSLAAVAASVLVLLLPETLARKLPDTLDEVE